MVDVVDGAAVVDVVDGAAVVDIVDGAAAAGPVAPPGRIDPILYRVALGVDPEDARKQAQAATDEIEGHMRRLKADQQDAEDAARLIAQRLEAAIHRTVQERERP